MNLREKKDDQPGADQELHEKYKHRLSFVHLFKGGWTST